MTLVEFYEKSGAEYKEVLGRLGNSERLLRKYLGKFLDDQTYERLDEAIAEENWDDILRQAHTLKGVSSNLSLTGVLKYSSEIVAAIRANEREKVLPLMEELRKSYAETIDWIQQIE